MMSYASAIDLLSRVSGWTRTQVEANPTDALWAASGKLVEARDVIQDTKDQRRTRR